MGKGVSDYTDDELKEFLQNEMGFTQEEFDAMVDEIDVVIQICNSSYAGGIINQDEVDRFIKIIKQLSSKGDDSAKDAYDRAMGIIY